MCLFLIDCLAALYLSGAWYRLKGLRGAGAATLALIVLAFSIPASMMAWRILPRNIAIPVSWVGYIWMGSMFVLLVLLWGGELARWGWVKYASMTSVSPTWSNPSLSAADAP